MRTNGPIGCRVLFAVALVFSSAALLMLALFERAASRALFASMMLVVGLVQIVLSHREAGRSLPPKD